MYKTTTKGKSICMLGLTLICFTNFDELFAIWTLLQLYQMDIRLMHYHLFFFFPSPELEYFFTFCYK
jgi:hypothetical protein